MKTPKVVRVLLRKPRFAFVYGFVAVSFVLAHTTEPAFRLGVVMVVLGEALRFWANGYVGHVKVNAGQCRIGRLITAGPYAFVRNPLYLGSFLIGIGFSVIIGSVWLGLGGVALFFVFYSRQIRKEEDLLQEEWRGVYLDYQAAVPRWAPTWRRYPRTQGSWDWKGIAASKEWKTVIWGFVLLLAFYFREELFQEHELFLAKGGVKRVVLLAIAVSLTALDGAFELSKRLARPAGRLVHSRNPWIFRQRKYLPLPFLLLGAGVLMTQRHPFRPGTFPRWVLDLLAWWLILAGEALRIWGMGYIGRKSRSSQIHASHLITSGPYAHTRHPLYFGGFLLTLGLSLLTGSIWIIAGCLAYWVLVYGPIVTTEERFLKQTFGEAYEAYRRSVPRWWLRLRPAPAAFQSKWHLSELRKEYQTVAAILVVLFLIQVLMVDSEWRMALRRSEPPAEAPKAQTVQIALSRPSSHPAAHHIRIESAPLKDLLREDGGHRPADATSSWLVDMMGITSGLSTFVAASIAEEIDDLHDEKRFNTMATVTILSAAVGIVVHDTINQWTNRPLPTSASAFSPQEAPARHWHPFVDPANREAGVVVTYTF